MTTDTLITSGQSDNATASSQNAPDASAAPAADAAQAAAAPDAQQQQQASADAPAAGDKPAEGAKDEGGKEGDKPAGAPEQYEDFKAPEGVTLDAEVTGKFKSLAKELNLPQEHAQKVADLGTELVQKVQSTIAEQHATAVAKWVTDTQADTEIGGDKLQENLAVAKKALNEFGSDQLKTLLNESGLGNHPEVIRLLHKVGKAISEDRFVSGKPGGTPVETAAQRMYPNMNP